MGVINSWYKSLHVLVAIDICCTGQPSFLSSDSESCISTGEINPGHWQTRSFNTTDNFRIRVNFTTFNLVPGLDSISIGDGLTADSSHNAVFTNVGRYTTLAKFSGATRPSHVTSIKNAVWIGFHIRSVSASFELKIAVVSQTDEAFLDASESYFIQSPGYPSNYPQNFYQIWYFKCADGFVVSVIVHHFDLEFEIDYLYIGDGARRFSNHGDTWHDLTGDSLQIRDYRDFTSLQSSVQIIFTTDFITVKSGFRIELRAVKQAVQTTRQSVGTTPIFPSTSGRSLQNDVVTFNSAIHPRTTTEKGVYGMQQMNSASNFVIIFGVFSGLFFVILLVVLLHCVVVKFHRRHLAQVAGRIYCTVTESAPALPPPRFTRRHRSLACASPPACPTGSCLEDNCDNHIMEGEVFSEPGNILYLNQLGVDSTMNADTYACVPDPLGKQCFDDGGETDTKISRHLGVDRSASQSDGDHKDAFHIKPRITGRKYGQEKSQYVCSTADHSRLTRGGFMEGSHDDTPPRGIRTKRRYDGDYVNVPSISTVTCDDSSSSTFSSRSGLEDSGLSNSSNHQPGHCPYSNRALKSIDSSGLPGSQVTGPSSNSSSTISTEDSRFPSCNIDEFGYLILDTSSPKCGGSRHNFQSLSHDDELRFHHSSNGHEDWTTSGRLHISPFQRSSRESLSSCSPLEHTYLDRENISYHNELHEFGK